MVMLTYPIICSMQSVLKQVSVYNVTKLYTAMKIDANWNKPEWQKVKSVEVNKFMGPVPKFEPVVNAKVMYDKENVYVIFQVKDCFVRCQTEEINGNVWEDSCVEFFFAPDTTSPEKYFNLEINCGGTPLMHYNAVAKKEIQTLKAGDIKMIEIAHTLPHRLDAEITEPVTWSLEYRIPISMLEKYSRVTHPAKGVKWRANFYKIAHKSSNRNYISWSKVDVRGIDMHLPEFFGELKFQ